MMELLFVAVLAILGFLCFTPPDGPAGQGIVADSWLGGIRSSRRSNANSACEGRIRI